jgi:hypothetical protein
MKKKLFQRVSEVSGAKKGKVVGRQRKHRARPTPRFLKREESDLDEVARRRCLMILSVLSGERPVTDVVEEAKMSRQTYYQLESRAVRAMLSALLPGGGESTSQAGSQARRVEELEEKVKRLEQDKRRSDRLLYVTRQVVKPGPLTTGVGRQPKGRGQRSTSNGKKLSKASKPAISNSSGSGASSTSSPAPAPSMPTAIEGER